MSRLPYFDMMLEQFRKDDPEFLQAFGRHVHWGFWERPEEADGTVEDYARATERLCQRICDAAQVRDGIDLLDVGCGFGGTLASLNERLHHTRMTGLNIDERQLERARTLVIPQSGNTIEFVHGDACRLPFADSSFDIVMAVECIFHFPSREKFFREARRVLRPGGRLTLSDYALTAPIAPTPESEILRERVARTYGPGTVQTMDDYRTLAAATGFSPAGLEDVTEGLIPGYRVAERLLRRISEEAGWATEVVRLEGESGLVRYVILSFV